MINSQSAERDGTRDPKSFPYSDFLDWKRDQNYSPFSIVKNTAFEAVLKWLYNGMLSVKQTFPRLSPSQTTTCTQEGSCFSFHLKDLVRNYKIDRISSKEGSFHLLKCKMENKIYENISIAWKLCLGKSFKDRAQYLFE